MQASKAKDLRDDGGGKPCDHPDFDKEYYLGAESGDYVCTTCGEVFSRRDYESIQRERSTKKDS